MTDIVERLCRTLSDLPGNDDDLFNEIHAQREEAAKEIKRLRAHAERADAADARAKRLENVAEAVEAQNTRLEAENERLREVLVYYAAECHGACCIGHDKFKTGCGSRARAALAKRKKKR